MKTLMYHEVGPPSDLLSNAMCTSEKNFEEHLKFYKDHFHLADPKILSDRDDSVLVTFDDGFKGNLKYALPLLEKYEIPAVFFITNEFVSHQSVPWSLAARKLVDLGVSSDLLKLLPLKDRFRYFFSLGFKSLIDLLKENFNYDFISKINELSSDKDIQKKYFDLFMNWDEVGFLAQSKFVTIGAHTVSHPILSKLNQEQQENEISESIREIKEKTGTEIYHFAYPFGRSEHYNRKTIDILKQNGIRYAFTTEKNKTETDSFQINRIGIHNEKVDELAQKVTA